MKLANGPAIETTASAFLTEIFLLKFLESISTGLPHPKPKNNSITIPIGSMCFNGFKLNLPCDFAVSSPNL